MDNLIKNYNEECQIVSNKSDVMWRIVIIILCSLFSILYFTLNEKIICTIIFLILTIIWFYACVFVYDRELKQKVSKKLDLKEKMKYYEYEQKLDEYQKGYMSNYIRKNKLNKSSKLNIIINEIQQKNNRKEEMKNIFVIPIVLAIFTSVVNYNSNAGLLVFITQYVTLAISAIIVINFFYKIYDCTTFNKYSGTGRLKELLIHTAMKHGK